MGKLAMWGGVAGAAKGAQENIESKIAGEQAAIDSQRAERLERMKQGHAKELEGMKQEGATGRTGMQIEGQIAVEEEKGFNKESAITLQEGYEFQQQDRDQAFDAEQGKLDRESKERIAKIQSKGSGAASAEKKAMLDRFESKVLSESDANEFGIQIETDTPAIYDNMSGTWYLQQGDKYVLPGTDPAQIARAPRSAIDYLFKHPELAPQFMKPKSENGYGYLPLGYLSVLRSSDMEKLQAE